MQDPAQALAASAVEQELLKIGARLEAAPEAPLELSLVVPAFNEERRLAGTLVAAWEFLKRTSRSYEIIVVDDGSTDATAELARQLTRLNPAIQLIRLGRNQGKGAAVRVGISNARGQYVIYADADGASRIDHLSRLLAAIKNGADVAIGSRASVGSETTVRKLWYRHVIGRAFHLLVRLAGVRGVRDTQCGFKLFRADAARAIFQLQVINGYAFDVEVLLLARQLGYTIAEVPIDWTHIPGSKVSLFRDPLLMLGEVLRVVVRHRILRPTGDATGPLRRARITKTAVSR